MKLEKNNKSKESKLKKERRNFLKKAAYTAPSVVVLGSLMKPKTAMAGDPYLPGVGGSDSKSIGWSN